MQNKNFSKTKNLSLTPVIPENVALPGLYIHVPFCISKCPYCGFYSITDLSLISDYLFALRREMDFFTNWAETFDTFYIGGGTPSVLSPRQIEKLILDARDAFNISEGAEITVEMNPADINSDLLNTIYRAGANRVSIGIQSFHDAVLSFLGRRHRSAIAADAIKTARKAGFENISIDLLYGVPGQDIDAWTETLQQAVALKADHISCYQLTAEKGTPLAQNIKSGLIALPDDVLQAKFFFLTAEFLEKYGYGQYEVSNFSLPGREARHNRKYWMHVPYLGLGPSAHSFSGWQRRWNIHSVHSYIEKLTGGNLPWEETEILDSEKMRMETLFLGLRTRSGISLNNFKILFDFDLMKEKKDVIDSLMSEGFVTISDGFLKPTRKGLAIADSLALIF
jgi:oxygen-independent coproporphyrinogen-3 oxidase